MWWGFCYIWSLVEINECQSMPCVNGECVDEVNGYHCNCNAGYQGTNCDGLYL